MRHHARLLRWTVLAICVSLVAGACTGGDDGEQPAAPGVVDDGTGPFALRLSTGDAVLASATPVAVVAGDRLDDDDVTAIVERLPALEADDDDRVEFRRPPESLPPPRVGDTVEAPFGVPESTAPPDVAPGPLEVVRYQPSGEVDVAPFISITFNQPMVPVGTLGQLDAADVPVEVRPAVEGRWRWIGTRTLRLEHTSDAIDRLPGATEYEVTVPAGTASATGGTLAEAFSFTFATPAPQLVSFHPGGNVIDTRPLFLATFDQRVDPAAVLETVRVAADGVERSVRLATDEEVAGDDEVRALTEQALEDRTVAFTTDDALPGDVAVEISIGPGTPSAEGPRTTAEPATRSTRTYARFQVTRTDCGFGGPCRAGSFLAVEFNNPLDPAAFDSDSVRIEPAVDAVFTPQENQLLVQAPTRPNTDYEVTLPAGLTDAFGQTLGADETVTFEIRDSAPMLRPFPSLVVTSDPFASVARVPIVSAGHETLDVTVYDVDTDDFRAYASALERWDPEAGIARLPDWPVLSSETIEVGGDPAEPGETSIDLSDEIGDAGHAVVVVRPNREFPRDSEDHWNNVPAVAWVQRTSLGLDVVVDRGRLVAWATDLDSGAPVEGVSIRRDGEGEPATTAGDGLATLDGGSARFLVAERDGDSAILASPWGGAWEPAPLRDEARWYTFDGRGLFRPGDELRVKGWVRRLSLGDGASIEPFGEATVRYVVRDGFGNELGDGDAELTDHGGFDFTTELPAGAASGPAEVELRLGGASGIADTYASHLFQIEEFRRPEFEVVTDPVSSEPQLLTRPVTLSATARYFAGGALPDSPVAWQVTTHDTIFTPPNRPDFSFGVAPPPWWFDDGPYGGGFRHGMGPAAGDVDFGEPCCIEDEAEHVTYTGRTDGSGVHVLDVEFTGQKPDEPIIVSANASVEDVNRQAFGSTIELLVHPAELYVGLRGQRNFVRQGEPLAVDVVVTDIDGVAVPGREVTVTAARITERWQDGELTEVDVDPEECVVASQEDPVSCTFATDTGRKYRITAIVRDDDGGANRTEIVRHVAGGEAVPSRSVDQQTVTLVPDATEYVPGDTIELLVAAPFADGSGLLTVSGTGVAESRTFEMDDGSAVLDIPVTDAHVPGIDVRVDVAGTAPRWADDGTTADDLPPRPAFASGQLPVVVRPVTRTLDVTAAPADRDVEPGGSTTVTVAVTDAGGTPVDGAEVAIAVVDEALLSLVAYELGDPIEAIYARHVEPLLVESSRAGILLDDPQVFGEAPTDPAAPPTPASGAAELDHLSGDDSDEAVAGGGGAADGALRQSAGRQPGQEIEVRRDFADVALFEPVVVTGGDGTATVEIDLPDSLTRYRVMAVAADTGNRFGSGESTVTARLPLQVRPSPPRFVNFGDTFELPVVLQNRTDEAITADVVLEVTNLSLTAGAGRRVEIPADQRIEVRFPVAAVDAGTARYRATVLGGEHSDSSTGSFPAYTPTTTEAFATYGVIDDGAVAQPFLSPEDVVEQFGGLEIDTSSTGVQTLTDAVVYLTDYEYESADAFASRITALVALRDVFAAFATPGQPAPEELDATIRADLERLVALQNDDGGFATWHRGRPSDPYLTVQAAHALVVAQDADYPVRQDAMERALDYLRNVESRFPVGWSPEARRPVEAYALYVRNLGGDRDAGKAERLFHSADDLPLDALAWLWPVVDDPAIGGAIDTTFANRVAETPSAATFTTDHDEQTAALVLASDRRTDGIALDALITMRPDSDLIPKIVTGLIGNQRKGRWDNVQENGFILLAMQRYFATYENVEPAFTARTWLGESYTAEHAHEGRSIDTTRTVVPIPELGGDPDIVLAKDGPGRLYYRLGLTYAPDDLALDPREEGFAVARSYEAVDDPGDVVRNGDGSWTIAPGAMVRVTLSMVADAHRTNMALVDHLPAGLEALNPGLAASPRPPAEDNEDDGTEPPATWFGFTWFDHQNFRDDRTEAFSAFLPAGTYEYTYVARATTPGTFVAPPAKAEEIYSPEVFGRSSTDIVTIG